MIPQSEIRLPDPVEAPPPAALPASVPSAPNTAQREIELIACRQMMDAGARLQARERLEALATLQADWRDPLMLLAELHLDQGDSREAEVVLRRLVRLAPDERWAAHRLAEVLSASGANDEAAQVYADLLARRPDDRLALRQYGLLLYRMARWPLASEILREAVLLDPADAEAAAALAFALAQDGQPLPALEAAAVARRRDRDARHALEIHYAIGRARQALGEPAAADVAYRRCLDIDPDDRLGVTALLAASQNALAAPSAGYVRALFDRYAERFDDSLVSRLAYRGPQILEDLLHGVDLPEDARILDLGCGTGLAAPVLRPLASRLVGVDLSSGMLAHARRRGLYDALEAADLQAFLAGGPAAWDLVVALDVVNYVGPLPPVFRAVAAVLDDRGLFALTLERSPTGGLLLQNSRRYAHGLADVEAAVADAGLQTVRLLETTLRTERGAPVAGYALLLRR